MHAENAISNFARYMWLTGWVNQKSKAKTTQSSKASKAENK
jgi:hypothetical protein